MQVDIINENTPLKRKYNAETRKRYYQLNKEKIRLQQQYRYTTKIKCDCGSCVTIKNMGRHYKSAKHLEYARNNL